MRTILMLPVLVLPVAPLLMTEAEEAKEVKYKAALAGVLKTKIVDREVDQRFSFQGILTVKGSDAVLISNRSGQELRIPGVLRNDKIFLAFSRFTEDGVTTVHYIATKDKDGTYKGTVASLIDTRNYVNEGTFNLLLSPQ